ncbi:hypothetical protein RJT34_12368 [Clitoria ternatea]|uniref:Reverse transcriptase domain-containing protein n=1 Tax=Clitoria ternatea TaxID=43366 RepID=A0AAN9PKM1_CLITE
MLLGEMDRSNNFIKEMESIRCRFTWYRSDMAIIAKVLTNRIRGVLNDVISPSQFGFLTGKNTLDVAVIVNEMLDETKKRNGNWLLFKVTLWKDSVWGCLSSILVNGSPTEQFLTFKGVRQRDPLALFLFLIIAEGISGLMKSAIEKGKDACFKVDRDEGGIMSLWDKCKEEQNNFTLKSILRCFELASGLKADFAKSKVTGLHCDE